MTLKSLNEDGEITDDFRITILNETLILLEKLTKLWDGLPSIDVIFSPINLLCKNLKLHNYPQTIAKTTEDLLSSIDRLPKVLNYLTKKSSNVKSLRMYEPAIEKM